MNVDIPTLVALVLARARTDTTAPDPKNLRVGWRTDQLLIGDIDTLMCYERNDPGAYAEIGRQVLAQVHDLPEIAALSRLAIFRGKRLLPVSDPRKRNLLEMVGELETFIGTLPAGTRKDRCSGLFHYHRGVFFNDYGCFAEAAKAQHQAADVAKKAGDVPGAAISSFVAVVYELKDALCLGVAERIETGFAELQHQYPLLITAVNGTAFEVSWGQGNAHLHLLEASVWLDQDSEEMDTWANTFNSVAEKLGSGWKDHLDFIHAVQLHRSGDMRAENALTVVATTSSVELRATALLILARRAKKEGDETGARGMVENMSEIGVQHLRAIAARLLE
ncbi:MAG: hypothetical protein EXS51_04070 [Candidatus Taylorbacteria bacterium]|nr:hypothetical protein [Candidatus Taylorbacteria bacterium]